MANFEEALWAVAERLATADFAADFRDAAPAEGAPHLRFGTPDALDKREFVDGEVIVGFWSDADAGGVVQLTETHPTGMWAVTMPGPRVAVPPRRFVWCGAASVHRRRAVADKPPAFVTAYEAEGEGRVLVLRARLGCPVPADADSAFPPDDDGDGADDDSGFGPADECEAWDDVIGFGPPRVPLRALAREMRLFAPGGTGYEAARARFSRVTTP